MDIGDNILLELAIETTKILNSKQNEFKKINWSNGEANLDTDFSQICCKYCTEAWTIITEKYEKYKDITIQCNIPDIDITFSSDNEKLKKKIELKSSKAKKMPGSTIKKLDINQPLIYCLRPSSEEGKYIIKCSQYHTAMGDSKFDLFQDRTPRPCISFSNMKDITENITYEHKNKKAWIEHYSKCSLERIKKESKDSIQYSWQDDLIIDIKKKILDEYIRNTSAIEFEQHKLALQLENLTI